MKKKALILAILVSFISYQGFAGGKHDNSAIEGGIKKINEELINIKGEIKNLGNPGPVDPDTKQITPIPVTPKIVQFLLKNDGNSNGLKFYPSEPFTLKIYEQNETAEIEIKNEKIILNPANPAKEKPIEFPINSEGILTGKSPGPDSGRELRIFFQKQGKTLIFRRNAQQNCYELFDVEVTDNKDYKVSVPESIRLYVSGEDRRKVEVHAVPVDFVYNNNQPLFDTSYNNAQPYQNRNTINYNDNYSYNVDYNKSVTPSRYVMSKGSLEPQRVIAYVKRINPAMNNSDIAIINEYFKEADGVNVDIAIAQMLYWTEYFKKRDRVATRNYGGLSNTSSFNGRFPRLMSDGMTEGVRAHIQHLMGYARVTPKQGIVDPRYQLAYDRGFRGIRFEQLYSIWSQNPHYGQNIENILRRLYQFSGVL